LGGGPRSDFHVSTSLDKSGAVCWHFLSGDNHAARSLLNGQFEQTSRWPAPQQASNYDIRIENQPQWPPR